MGRKKEIPQVGGVRNQWGERSRGQAESRPAGTKQLSGRENEKTGSRLAKKLSFEESAPDERKESR